MDGMAGREKPKTGHQPGWIIAAEKADREVRSLRYQLKAARFPIHRDLMSFDWAESPLTAAQLEQLGTGAFMDLAHNVILVGGTGTTPLATWASQRFTKENGLDSLMQWIWSMHWKKKRRGEKAAI